VGTAPGTITVDSDGRRGFVANSGDGTVSVFDLDSGVAIGSVDAGSRPGAVLVDSTRNRLFVTSRDEDMVSAFDEHSLDGVFSAPVGAVAGSTDGQGIAANSTDGQLFVVSGSPRPVGGPLYAGLVNIVTVLDEDTGAELDHFLVPPQYANARATALAFDEVNDALYASYWQTGPSPRSLVAFDAKTHDRLSEVALSNEANPTSIVVDAPLQRVFVGDSPGTGVPYAPLFVLATPLVTPSRPIPPVAPFFPSSGGSLALDLGLQVVYAARTWQSDVGPSGSLSATDAKGGAQIAIVPLPGPPGGVAVDQITHLVYVTDAAGSDIWVLTPPGSVPLQSK
jgi:DNA-binding beta-propeller fold protein YncE